MFVLDLIAAVLIGVTAWSVFVLFSPYRTCRWCRNRKKRGRSCWRCKGTRLTRRAGSRHIHKVKLSLRQAWEEREPRR